MEAAVAGRCTSKLRSDAPLVREGFLVEPGEPVADEGPETLAFEAVEALASALEDAYQAGLAQDA